MKLSQAKSVLRELETIAITKRRINSKSLSRYRSW